MVKRDELLDRYAVLCDREPDGQTLTLMDRMRGGFYRTRSTRSGGMLEVEAYPMLPPMARAKLRTTHATSEAQANLNRRNAEKRFRRLAEINFRDEQDYYFTGTIEEREDVLLPTLDEVEKIFANFIRRVNYHRKKLGFPNAKYLAVIEGYEENGRQKRLHCHLLIEGGPGRDTMEKLWTEGVAQCRRLVKAKLDEVCSYLMKDPRGRKRWKYSKGNLEQPIVTYADRKISANAAWRVARDVAGRAAALERLYPGYKIDGDVEVRSNPYIPGAYIYARLRRKETKNERRARKRRWTR